MEIDCRSLSVSKVTGRISSIVEPCVAVLTVGVLSAGKDETAAEIAHVSGDSLHLLLGEVIPIHVADNHSVIGVQFVGSGRQLSALVTST